MHHDPQLLKRLERFDPIPFQGEVFRATGLRVDPLAPSTGGRWMVSNETATLYTSAQSDGAIAEIAYHWSQFSPLPSRHAMLHRIQLQTRKSLRLRQADLIDLGVAWETYETLNYKRTREIGAAVAHLDCDGLIVPSARWPCENVLVFVANLLEPEEALTLIDSREIDWAAAAAGQRRP